MKNAPKNLLQPRMPRARYFFESFAICLLMAFISLGCNTQSRAALDSDKEAASSSSTYRTKAPGADLSGIEAADDNTKGIKSKVAKVIFVGQKECCHCTKDRIKASWDALQAALTGTKGIDVERFDVDVDEDRANKLDKLGRIMVIPGVYLLDSQGKLVKLFQGQVEQDQIAKVLF